MIKSAGIYRLVNVYNGKCYVGQTCDFARRFKEHFAALRAHKHKNAKLQKAYNKYWRYFRFEILEYCSVKDLCEREKYWVHFYDAIKNGYNIQSVETPRNYKRNKESNERKRKRQ